MLPAFHSDTVRKILLCSAGTWAQNDIVAEHTDDMIALSARKLSRAILYTLPVFHPLKKRTIHILIGPDISCANTGHAWLLT